MHQKTGPLHYCTKLLKQITKRSAIQCENVTEDMLHPILQQMFKMVSVPLHGHKPEDIVSKLSIRQSAHRQLSAVQQTRPQPDAAAVVLSNV